MMRGWDLDPEKDVDKVYRLPGGSFIQKKDADLLRQMRERHDAELEAAISEDETGEGFIYEIFFYKFNGAMFEQAYAPRFIAELKANPDARALLNKLYKMDKDGKRIALVCFCDNEWLCHRSILAGLLRGAGCRVNTNASFIWYWDQWRAQ